MGKLLFEFKAVHKALGGIETDVAVYDNKIELKRKVSGVIAMNTKLPSETIAYYNDLMAINYVKPTLSSSNIGWIELVGISRDKNVMETVDVNKAIFSNVDTVNSLKNPYCIAFNKNKSEMEAFYNRMKDIFETYNAESKHAQGISAVVQSESSLDKIKKLKDLLDMGAISEAEFDEKKKELLNNI